MRGLGTSWKFKHSDIRIIGVPEREEEEQEIENLVEKIMKTFPNLARKIDFRKSRNLRESQTSLTQRSTHQGTS